MSVSVRQFRCAILDLVSLRRERLDALLLPDEDLQALVWCALGSDHAKSTESQDFMPTR